jgi:hypothetical protein
MFSACAEMFCRLNGISAFAFPVMPAAFFGRKLSMSGIRPAHSV